MAKLELRPNCELCGKDLPPRSSDARICTYECTYCSDCAERVLRNVCINCGGNLERRPIRPLRNWREGENTGLRNHPPSEKHVTTPYSRDEIARHMARLEKILPEDR